MSYPIDARKVRGVVNETLNALNRERSFNRGEMIVGLAEVIGRIVVDTASNHIAMKEMVDVVKDHLDRTIKTGAEAKEKRVILPE